MTEPGAEECPLCGSLQRFARNLREHEGGWLVGYISCTVCPYSQELGTTTRELERLRRRMADLRAREQREIERYGGYSRSTADAMQRVRQRQQELRAALNAKVKAHERDNSSTADA